MLNRTPFKMSDILRNIEKCEQFRFNNLYSTKNLVR